MRKEFLFEEFLHTLRPKKLKFTLLPPINEQPHVRPAESKTRTRVRCPALLPTFRSEGKDGQITMSAHGLRRILDMAEKVLPRRSTAPAMGLIRMESGDKRVRAYCINLETQLVVHIDDSLNVNGKGTCVLDVDSLRRLSKITASAFRFALNGSNLEVECACKGNSQREVLENGSMKDLPEMARAPRSFKRVVGLGQALYEAVRFASNEATRFALTGIRLDAQDVVSSDGKRLYCRTLPDLHVSQAMTIPIGKLLASKQMVAGYLSVATGDRLWLRGQDWLFSVRPLEGATFPQYRDVIPKRFANRWKLSHQQIDRVKRVLQTLPYPKDKPFVRLCFEKAAAGHRVRFTTDKDERAEVTVENIEYHGVGGALSLNASYLFDAISVEGITHVGWNDPSSAVGLVGRNIMALVMPASQPTGRSK